MSTSTRPMFMGSSRRRRSSTFRPTAANNYPKHKWSKFENLPAPVLYSIFSQLETKDILSVCLTSRLLYLPAAVQLYKKIIIVSPATLQRDKEVYSENGLFNPTIITIEQLPRLLTVALSHKKIARYVKSLMILDRSVNWNDKLRTIGVMSETPFTPEMKLMDLLRFVFQYLKLGEFVCPSLPLDQLTCMSNYNNHANIKKLVISVRLADVLNLASDNFSDLKLAQLTHLKVFFEENVSVNISKLADILYRNGCFVNLKALEFESLVLASKMKGVPSFLAFFVSLSKYIKSSEKRLNLKTLSLNSSIPNASLTASILDSTVQLDKLIGLQLQVVESSHRSEPHNEFFDRDLKNSNILINLLAPLLKDLKHISLSPSKNCLICQLNSIVYALTCLKNQLKSISLTFDSMTIKDTLLINRTIYDTQKNLVNLKWNDRSQLVVFKRDLEYWLSKSLDKYEDSLHQRDTAESFIYPFYHDLASMYGEFMVDNLMSRFLDENQLDLKEFFKLYLINNYNYQYLDKLRKLEFLNLYGFQLYINNESDVVQFIRNRGKMVDCFEI